MVKHKAMEDDPTLISKTQWGVRRHLSSVVSPTDDDSEFEAYADVWTENQANGDVLVCGDIPYAPNAPYLKDGWSIADDLAANPLGVESIDDNPAVTDHLRDGNGGDNT